MNIATSFWIVFWVGVSVQGRELSSVYMKTSKSDDQAMLGSEFSYGAEIPADLYESDSVESPKTPVNFENDPAFVERYAKAVPISSYEVRQLLPQEKVQYVPYSIVDYYKNLGAPQAAGYGQGNYITKFIDEHGNVYDLTDVTKYGVADKSGFDTVRQFDKKLKGKHSNSENKAYYDAKGGKKEKALEKDGNYAVSDQYGTVNQGGSFAEKKGHKKGGNTSGYHKIYRKNDYNKQHKFYDVADRRGHFRKYGNLNAKEGSGSGYYVKGNNRGERYDGKKVSAKGVKDKGYLDEYLKNYKGASGKDAFVKEYANFDKDEGSEKAQQQYSADVLK
ncbi:uncharacterized protein LOC115881243 [Sitophilus oryzae]|uniref:Uncharacterized protein LOC115881243 n=1 Tax=Sitophilus oryzae TaxID=7048 RepID=A0A6J2XU11_SITOR|nr:uncharacterized protein LOC115881243 [Sitophilus oryzae]